MSTADILARNAPDEATQALRLEAAKGKNVLWITLSYSSWLGVIATAGEIHYLGINKYMVFTTTDAGRALAEKCQEAGYLADNTPIFADMSDENTAVDNIIAAAEATGVKFDGVFSPYEHSQVLVGEIAERMNLPGNTKAAYVAARNKHMTRVLCREANIPTPLTMRVKCKADLEVVKEQLGFPVVVKPQSGAGSDGVYKCSTYEELVAAYAKSDTALHENTLLKWNPGCEEGIVVESYIDGDEFDVDLLFWDGECVYGNANDNWATMEPTFLETGSNCPSVFSSKVQQQLVEYGLACVKALGFKQGCFHVECKYSMKPHRVTVDADGETIGQPLLIEVNPRMGGGRTHYFHKNVYNVDLFDNFLMTACGIPINPPRVPEPLVCLADYDICAEKTGLLLHNRWLDHVKGHPQMLRCEVYSEAGAKVKGADTGLPEWLGLMILKGTTPDDTVNTLRAIVATIEPPIVAEGSEKEGKKSEEAVVEPVVVAA